MEPSGLPQINLWLRYNAVSFYDGDTFAVGAIITHTRRECSEYVLVGFVATPEGSEEDLIFALLVPNSASVTSECMPFLAYVRNGKGTTQQIVHSSSPSLVDTVVVSSFLDCQQLTQQLHKWKVTGGCKTAAYNFSVTGSHQRSSMKMTAPLPLAIAGLISPAVPPMAATAPPAVPPIEHPPLPALAHTVPPTVSPAALPAFSTYELQRVVSMQDNQAELTRLGLNLPRVQQPKKPPKKRPASTGPTGPTRVCLPRQAADACRASCARLAASGILCVC